MSAIQQFLPQKRLFAARKPHQTSGSGHTAPASCTRVYFSDPQALYRWAAMVGATVVRTTAPQELKPPQLRLGHADVQGVAVASASELWLDASGVPRAVCRHAARRPPAPNMRRLMSFPYQAVPVVKPTAEGQLHWFLATDGELWCQEGAKILGFPLPA